MPIDLDAIKQRNLINMAGDYAQEDEDIAALITEVERLQERNTREYRRGYTKGHKAGITEEGGFA